PPPHPTTIPYTTLFRSGRRQTVEQDEVIVELNEHVTKFFVVVSGQLHVLQVSNNQENVVAICNPGMFTGELNVLSGRRGLVRIRDRKSTRLNSSHVKIS